DVRGGANLRLEQDLQGERGPVRGDGERHGVVLVTADDLNGARLVVGLGVRVPLDHAQVVLQGPADDGLVGRDAGRAGVGGDDDGEVAVGDQEEFGELAVAGAAV